MQAKSRRGSASRRPRRKSGVESPLAMRTPAQRPPVERLYMRPIVGRNGLSAKKGTAPRKRAGQQAAGDFVVELTIAHSGRRRRW